MSTQADATHLLEEAVAFAAERHAGQLRKGSGLPYIVHPLEACAICARITSDEEVLAAAVLHDVLEDTATTPSELRARFGERVASIVGATSEDKRRDRPAAATWRERKQETIREIEGERDLAVLSVCLADKLSNLRSTRADQLVRGDAVWERFNERDPAAHAWYYRSITRALEPTLGHTGAWTELAKLVEEVFSGV